MWGTFAPPDYLGVSSFTKKSQNWKREREIEREREKENLNSNYLERKGLTRQQQNRKGMATLKNLVLLLSGQLLRNLCNCFIGCRWQ